MNFFVFIVNIWQRLVFNAGSEDSDTKPSHATVDSAGADQHYHRFDEQVNICLDCDTDVLQPLPRKYIR